MACCSQNLRFPLLIIIYAIFSVLTVEGGYRGISIDADTDTTIVVNKVSKNDHRAHQHSFVLSIVTLLSPPKTTAASGSLNISIR
jgi:hypothetical protein